MMMVSSLSCQKMPIFYTNSGAENPFFGGFNFWRILLVFAKNTTHKFLLRLWLNHLNFCHFLRILNGSFAEIPPSQECVMYIYIYKYTLRILVLGNIEHTVTSLPHPVFDSLLDDAFSARHTPLPSGSEKNSLCTVITGDGRGSKNHDGEGDQKPLSDTLCLAIELTLDGWNAVEHTRLDHCPLKIRNDRLRGVNVDYPQNYWKNNMKGKYDERL